MEQYSLENSNCFVGKEYTNDYEDFGINFGKFRSEIIVLPDLQIVNLDKTSTSSTSDEKEVLNNKRKKNIEDLEFEHIFDKTEELANGIELFNNLPVRFSKALNEGNLKVIKDITTMMDPRITFSISSPSFTVEKRGVDIPVQIFTAILNTHPDAVISVSRTRTERREDFLQIIGSIRMKGTRVHSKYFNNFFGLRDDVLASEAFLDKNKTTVDKFQRLKAIEMEAVSSGRKIQVFMKVNLSITFDIVTQRVVKHCSNIRLSSLRQAILDFDCE